MREPVSQAAATTLEKLQLLREKGEIDRATFDALAAGLHAQLAGAGAIAQGPGSLAVGAKSVAPRTPEAAQRASGYLIGGTSPFAINGGARGFLVGVAPRVVSQVLGARPVSCAL